jgi:hypothetical protein
MSLVWKKASFEKEKNEFERVVNNFTANDKNYKVEFKKNFEYLKKEYSTSNIQDLSDSVWKILDNTGSWKVNTFSDLFLNLRKDGVKRDVSRIVSQFVGIGEVNDFRGTVECPIILMAGGQTPKYYHLIAGNTRLTIARILKIKPKLVIIKTDW